MTIITWKSLVHSNAFFFFSMWFIFTFRVWWILAEPVPNLGYNYRATKINLWTNIFISIETPTKAICYSMGMKLISMNESSLGYIDDKEHSIYIYSYKRKSIRFLGLYNIPHAVFLLGVHKDDKYRVTV